MILIWRDNIDVTSCDPGPDNWRGIRFQEVYLLKILCCGCLCVIFIFAAALLNLSIQLRSCLA